MLDEGKRFIAILGALIVAGFLATSLVSYFAARDSLSDQIAENVLPLTSDNIYSEIQRDLMQPIFISSLMAQDTFVRDWVLSGEEEPGRIVRYLKEIQDRYKTITSFFVSERSQMYYHPSGVHRRVAEDNPRDAWYFRVRDMAEDYEINVDPDEVNRDTVTIFVNHKVYDFSGRYIGATGAGLSVTAVKEMLEAYRQRFDRTDYFIDRQGNVTLHSKDFERPANIRDDESLAEFAPRILTSPSESFSYKRDGRTYYVNSRAIPELQQILLVEQDEGRAGASILNTLLGNLAVCLVITLVVILIASITMRGYRRRIETIATTDELTGLANRQLLSTVLDQNIKAVKRKESPLSLVIFDIDHFKSVNDKHGHVVGDAVIRNIADIARRHVRESDFLCRWGGEEFLVILPDCDDAQARGFAERIRRNVEVAVSRSGKTNVSVSISLGIAQFRDGDTGGVLIKRSDAALLAAKEAGRNRVIMAE